jgi:hypothetical protein
MDQNEPVMQVRRHVNKGMIVLCYLLYEPVHFRNYLLPVWK